MSTRDDDLGGIPRSKAVSMLLDWSGAKVYMTRPALRELAAELLRISDADPRECYEVHLSMFFSHFDQNDRFTVPRARLANGLAPILKKISREFWKDEIGDFEADAGAEAAGFDVTIMHVSPEAVRKESERPDE